MLKAKRVMQQAQLVMFSRQVSKAPVANTSGAQAAGFGSFITEAHNATVPGYNTTSMVTEAVTGAGTAVTLTSKIVNDLLSDIIVEGGASEGSDENTIMNAYGHPNVIRKIAAFSTNNARTWNLDDVGGKGAHQRPCDHLRHRGRAYFDAEEQCVDGDPRSQSRQQHHFQRPLHH